MSQPVQGYAQGLGGQRLLDSIQHLKLSLDLETNACLGSRQAVSESYIPALSGAQGFVMGVRVSPVPHYVCRTPANVILHMMHLHSGRSLVMRAQALRGPHACYNATTIASRLIQNILGMTVTISYHDCKHVPCHPFG